MGCHRTQYQSLVRRLPLEDERWYWVIRTGNHRHAHGYTETREEAERAIELAWLDLEPEVIDLDQDGTENE